MINVFCQPLPPLIIRPRKETFLVPHDDCRRIVFRLARYACMLIRQQRKPEVYIFFFLSF